MSFVFLSAVLRKTLGPVQLYNTGGLWSSMDSDSGVLPVGGHDSSKEGDSSREPKDRSHGRLCLTDPREGRGHAGVRGEVLVR